MYAYVLEDDAPYSMPLAASERSCSHLMLCGRLLLPLHCRSPFAVMQLELTSSSGASLAPGWQSRQQVILQQVVDYANLQQHCKFNAAQAAAGNKVTKVYYRVMQHGPGWHWLRVSLKFAAGAGAFVVRQTQHVSQAVLHALVLVFGCGAVGRQSATCT
jgi:hypothetical protein